MTGPILHHLHPSNFSLPPHASSAVRAPIFARLDPVVHPSHGRDLASQRLAFFVTSQANRSISICVTVQVQMLFFISPTSINVTIFFWECRAKIGESLRMSLHMCVHISFQWFTPPVPLSRCHLTSRCLKVMATCFFQWDMQRD